MMTYNEAKNTKNLLEIIVDGFSKELHKFPKLSNGLVPDDVRSTLEWKEAKQGYDVSFNKLRRFNAVFTKTFKKEIKADIKAKREQRMSA